MKALLAELERATGTDTAIDARIATAFGAAVTGYTASADPCVELLKAKLPGWTWHVGWAGSGVFPYARLEHDGHKVRVEAPTVPLALIRAIVRAKLEDYDRPMQAPEKPPWQR